MPQEITAPPAKTSGRDLWNEGASRAPPDEVQRRRAVPPRCLVRLDDGTYLDVLRWESRPAADAATERYTAIPEAGEVHGHFDENLAHHRGKVAVA
jgi:hypothetical protein